MKITLEKLIELDNIAISNDRVNVAAEIMSILSTEALSKGLEQGFHEVTLTINGIEHEPKIFARMVENQHKYIEEKAKELVREKYTSAIEKAQEIVENIEVLSNKF